MRKMAKTGLIVDLIGKGPANGENKLIAFRADMDALKMTELNTQLEYCSKDKNAAHMCGHDGHTACLLGAASLIQEKIHRIPSNKGIRLLF
jgi:hippurate hydrolase